MEKRLFHIGIVGLGLIGGSLAKALDKYTSHVLYGYDQDAQALELAGEMIDGKLDNKLLSQCDILFLALYPQAAVQYVLEHMEFFKPGCLIADLCGVKRYLMERLAAPCQAHGFYYFGCHPMAGRDMWGYSASDADLFQGASMLLAPMEGASQEDAALLSDLFLEIGFGRVEKTTPEKHDSMIAFTSQLAHVVSSAYIKSPRALEHDGFSAGSYKDLTRVAKLNPQMWTELFLENGDMLVREIDEIILHLTEYREAILDNDADRLYDLLDTGRKIKEGLGQ